MKIACLSSPCLNCLKQPKKQEWFIQANQLDPQAVIVNCQTPNSEQLSRWVKHRTKNMGLSADEEAIQLLCYSYENNLLALKQALQLLDLLYPDHKLTYNRVKSVVEQSSVFTPFQWIDALLSGKANRSKRILRGLQAEDVQPVILLRTLQRELLTLLELTKPQLRNPSLNTSCQHRHSKRILTVSKFGRIVVIFIWQRYNDSPIKSSLKYYKSWQILSAQPSKNMVKMCG